MLIPGARVVRTLSVPVNRAGPVSRQKPHGADFPLRSRRTRRQGIKDRSANDPTEELHKRENCCTEGTESAYEQHSEPATNPSGEAVHQHFTPRLYAPHGSGRFTHVIAGLNSPPLTRKKTQAVTVSEMPKPKAMSARRARSVGISGIGRPRSAAHTRL